MGLASDSLSHAFTAFVYSPQQGTVIGQEVASSGLGWGSPKNLETSQGHIQRFHEASEMEAPSF